MKQFLQKSVSALLLLFAYCVTAVADDFTVERAINLGQLDSWADISQFQWQEIDHGIQDNHEEMDALKTLFHDPAPKDTVGFYDQIYKARDNQYIVLRLDKAQGNRPFHIRVTCIKDANDLSKNTTKVFAAENYAYIMPPITENQLEVKIWPQGQGEETAKTYTFNIHGYGSASVRSVMLDKSRIVPGDYALQLIRYNSDTQVSDTAYIRSLQVDKLYTFYDYDNGDLVEAYLMADNFKRIKLNHEWWARDAVTHVSDNTVTVMTGPKMPFRQHKRLEAPNPTYLDSRLFSYHDTLWVRLFRDNEPSIETEGLTMHAVQADTTNMPGDRLLKWGLDSVSKRLYVLTDGEPATIECYRDGYLPKLCMYPGSYNHKTGIIDSETEVADIYLESISEPVTSPRVTSSIISTLTPTLDLRGDVYVSSIQSSDILPVLTTETVYYDEFASHKDTMKVANENRYMSYAGMEVAIVAPKSYETKAAITLVKAKNDAEENAILNDTLKGNTRAITSEFYDYKYWTTKFDLHEYLDINTSGRPAVAFDGKSVRELPILYNKYLDLEKMQADAREAAEERLKGDKAEDEASGWMHDMAPEAFNQLNFKVPLVPPFYFRLGLGIDFYKAKKLTVSEALGVGVDYQYDMANKQTKYWPNDASSCKVTMGRSDNYDFEDKALAPDLNTLLGLTKSNKDLANYSSDIYLSAFAELYEKFSIPLSLEGGDWKQWFLGMQFVDEAGMRAEAAANVRFGMNFTNMVGALGSKAGAPSAVTKFSNWLNKNKLVNVVSNILGPSVTAGAGVKIGINTGLFAFDNTTESTDPLKNHILAFKFYGQAYINGRIRAKIDAFIAGAEFGLLAGAGITFKYAAGSRLDFRNEFSGSAWSWYAGLGAYYKVKVLCWSKHKSWDLLGDVSAEEKLIKPKNYENPFHKNFAYYLSDEADPDKKPAAAALPGELVSRYADFNQPVKFITGSDSIIYQGNQGSPDDPNTMTVEVASLDNPFIISDWRSGGCTDYDAASVPGLDLAVMEQATAEIPKEQLEDSLTLETSVKEGSKVYAIYYTKKQPGTKWYSPKPIYSSPETTSFKPRLAMADDGKAVAIWQEGTFEKASWVQEGDTVQLTDLLMNGHLMMSRFDGNETWSEPVQLAEVNEGFCLKDYRVVYDGTSAFIVARRGISGAPDENVGFMVDGNNTVTTQTLDYTDEPVRLRRVGDYNLMAWMSVADSISSTTCVRVKSCGMDGKDKKGINSSLILRDISADEFTIVPDMEAKSLSNVALLWREQAFENDTTRMRLRASRLVPNQDGSFHLGSPITAVQLDGNATIYSFDGYMTKEKIDVCYIGADNDGTVQLNRKAAYFGNAFGYTVQFDPDENQGFQCHKDEVSLLVTVTNYGTSTIKNCVLTVDSTKTYPLDMTIPAGAYAQERVIIPYTLGSGINTKMKVEYDDVLGIKDEEEISNNARSFFRASADGDERGQNIHERETPSFFPYMPRLECFVVAQRVDKNGDNYITVCVRNYARRRLPKGFAIIVGLKETSYGSIVYTTKGNDHIKYETKKLLCNLADESDDSNYMYDYGSYRGGCVTLKVPGVTEKEKMYVGATLAYRVPGFDTYARVQARTFSGSDNSGVVTLYPSSEVVAVKHVYNNNDTKATIHVSREANKLVVTGVKANEQVRLYQANGTVIARKQAGEDGKVIFPVTYNSGVGLVSSGKETVKFVY